MTITLPPFLAVLGIVLGGGAIGAAAAFVWGLVCLATMDTGPDWPMALFWPVVAVATIGGWIWLASLA